LDVVFTEVTGYRTCIPNDSLILEFSTPIILPFLLFCNPITTHLFYRRGVKQIVLVILTANPTGLWTVKMSFLIQTVYLSSLFLEPYP